MSPSNILQIAPIKWHASKQTHQIKNRYVGTTYMCHLYFDDIENFAWRRTKYKDEDDNVNGQDDTITWFLPICITLSLFVIHWCIILCLMINVLAQLGVAVSRWYTCLTFIYNYFAFWNTQILEEMNIMIYMTQNDGKTLYNTVC